jgi:hypothetical protein
VGKIMDEKKEKKEVETTEREEYSYLEFAYQKLLARKGKK